jgi:hypothetical protein
MEFGLAMIVAACTRCELESCLEKLCQKDGEHYVVLNCLRKTSPKSRRIDMTQVDLSDILQHPVQFWLHQDRAGCSRYNERCIVPLPEVGLGACIIQLGKRATSRQ